MPRGKKTEEDQAPSENESPEQEQQAAAEQTPEEEQAPPEDESPEAESGDVLRHEMGAKAPLDISGYVTSIRNLPAFQLGDQKLQVWQVQTALNQQAEIEAFAHRRPIPGYHVQSRILRGVEYLVLPGNWQITYETALSLCAHWPHLTKFARQHRSNKVVEPVSQSVQQFAMTRNQIIGWLANLDAATYDQVLADVRNRRAT